MKNKKNKNQFLSTATKATLAVTVATGSFAGVGLELPKAQASETGFEASKVNLNHFNVTDVSGGVAISLTTGGPSKNDVGVMTEEIHVPAKINGKNVVAIADNGFTQSSISIEAKKVYFENPSLIVTIGENAFRNTQHITTPLEFPNVKTIGAAAFNKSNIPSISFGNGSSVVSIGANAFLNTVATNKLSFINLETVNKSTFQDSKFSEIKLNPYKVKSIGESAFQRAVATNTIDLPLIVDIPNNAFANSQFSEISFGDGKQVKTIGDSALKSTVATNSLIFENLVTAGLSVFSQSQFKEISFGTGMSLTSFRSGFDRTVATNVVNIPHATRLTANAFNNAKLSRINADFSKITELFKNAFAGIDSSVITTDGAITFKASVSLGENALDLKTTPWIARFEDPNNVTFGDIVFGDPSTSTVIVDAPQGSVAYNYAVTNGYTLLEDYNNNSNSDTTPPVVELSSVMEDTIKAKIEVTATDNDAVSEIKWLSGTRTVTDFANGGIDITESKTFEVTENGSYTVYAKDANGNETINSIEVTGINKASDLTIDTNEKVFVVDDNGVITISGTYTDKGNNPTTSVTGAIGTVTAQATLDNGKYVLVFNGADFANGVTAGTVIVTADNGVAIGTEELNGVLIKVNNANEYKQLLNDFNSDYQSLTTAQHDLIYNAAQAIETYKNDVTEANKQAAETALISLTTTGITTTDSTAFINSDEVIKVTDLVSKLQTAESTISTNDFATVQTKFEQLSANNKVTLKPRLEALNNYHTANTLLESLETVVQQYVQGTVGDLSGITENDLTGVRNAILNTNDTPQNNYRTKLETRYDSFGTNYAANGGSYTVKPINDTGTSPGGETSTGGNGGSTSGNGTSSNGGTSTGGNGGSTSGNDTSSNGGTSTGGNGGSTSGNGTSSNGGTSTGGNGGSTSGNDTSSNGDNSSTNEVPSTEGENGTSTDASNTNKEDQTNDSNTSTDNSNGQVDDVKVYKSVEDAPKSLQEKIEDVAVVSTINEDNLQLNVVATTNAPNNDLSNVSNVIVKEDGIYLRVDDAEICVEDIAVGETINLKDSTAVRDINGTNLPVMHYVDKDDNELVITSSNLKGIIVSNKSRHPFKDVNVDDWYDSFIDETYNYSMIKGTSATTYSPSKDLTRAQLATMLSRALELSSTNASTYTLSDIEGTWYAGDVQALVNAGIITGANGKFEGYKKVTRQQAAAMIGRALEYLKVETAYTGQVDFEDKANISEYAKGYVQFLAENDVLESGEDANFNPKAQITRAQVSKVLIKALQLSDKY